MASTEEINLPDIQDLSTDQLPSKSSPRKYEIIYIAVLAYLYWHIAAIIVLNKSFFFLSFFLSIYGMYLSFTSTNWTTLLFNFVLYVLAEIGTTAGAHRLWSHRSYKAKMPLQILLMVMQSISFQLSVANWVRDHRMHHKYTDTDGDPHNASRGFFFSHIGWLIVKKLPELKKRGKDIDMSDINNNSVLRFQKKYALPFIGSTCFLIPTLIPVYFWGETWSNAWYVSMLRYVLSLNAILMVNSVAHKWGYKPYDKSILAVQNGIVNLATVGEGFHNYHHVFPWDYRSAELGNNYLNFTTAFIDFFTWIGWAYDLKVAPDQLVKQRMLRTGDGTNLCRYKDM